MTRQLLFSLLVMSSLIAFGQVDKTSALYKTIKEKDSLLFNLGFNNCDIKQFENLVSENFKFYHDQSRSTFANDMGSLVPSTSWNDSTSWKSQYKTYRFQSIYCNVWKKRAYWPCYIALIWPFLALIINIKRGQRKTIWGGQRLRIFHLAFLAE